MNDHKMRMKMLRWYKCLRRRRSSLTNRGEKKKYVERMLATLSESGNCSWIHNLQLPESFHTFFASKWERQQLRFCVYLTACSEYLTSIDRHQIKWIFHFVSLCTWVFKCFRVRYLRSDPISCFYLYRPGLATTSKIVFFSHCVSRSLFYDEGCCEGEPFCQRLSDNLPLLRISWHIASSHLHVSL